MLDETKKKSVKNKTVADWKCTLAPGAFILMVFGKIWWGCGLRSLKIIFVKSLMDQCKIIEDSETVLGRQWLKV